MTIQTSVLIETLKKIGGDIHAVAAIARDESGDS